MGHDGKESTSPGPRPLPLSPIDDVTCPWVMCTCLDPESSAPPSQTQTERKYFILILFGLSLWAAKSYFV